MEDSLPLSLAHIGSLSLSQTPSPYHTYSCIGISGYASHTCGQPSEDGRLALSEADYLRVCKRARVSICARVRTGSYLAVAGPSLFLPSHKALMKVELIRILVTIVGASRLHRPNSCINRRGPIHLRMAGFSYRDLLLYDIFEDMIFSKTT
jgi:hypothetical protein